MLDNKIRPLPLIEFGADMPSITLINGTSDVMYFQIVNRNGTPYDITSGTVASAIYNANTGAVVATTGSTTAKAQSALGIVSFSGYTWATGLYNYYVLLEQVGGISRIFGPYRVEVEAL